MMISTVMSMSVSLLVLRILSTRIRSGSLTRRCMASSKVHACGTWSCMSTFCLKASSAVATNPAYMFTGIARVVSSWLLSTLMILSSVAAPLLWSLILNALWLLSLTSLIWGSSLRFLASRSPGIILVNVSISNKQTSFIIKDAISKFGFDYLPACRTPMDHTADLTPTPGFKADLSYRSMVGTLAWVANWTRPELTFVVHKLQRSQSTSVYRYLKGTQSERLRLGGDLVLRAFTDADFCSDRADGKSVYGYVLLLGDAPIVWASRFQGAVGTSTVETEYLALCSVVKDIMWLRHLLLVDLGCPQHDPTTNRHFHVSYHLAKEQVSIGTIKMFYIRTHDQVADILTKALNAEYFE
ncbi:unnamed protein product, partial [Heterosigma akashiwo]